MKELERREIFFKIISALVVVAFVGSISTFICCLIGAFTGFVSNSPGSVAVFLRLGGAGAILSVISWAIGDPVCNYHNHLAAAKQYRKESILYDTYISHIKMSFDTFYPIYLASNKSWTVDTESAVHKRQKIDDSDREYKSRSCILGSDEYITVVYFDFRNFNRYFRWVSQKQKEERIAAERKAEAEKHKKELDLNLMFLEAVAKDVEKMKISAEEELNKGLTELERIRDNISQ